MSEQFEGKNSRNEEKTKKCTVSNSCEAERRREREGIKCSNVAEYGTKSEKETDAKKDKK
jgi:hypothetical protein